MSESSLEENEPNLQLLREGLVRYLEGKLESLEVNNIQSQLLTPAARQAAIEYLKREIASVKADAAGGMSETAIIARCYAIQNEERGMEESDYIKTHPDTQI